jgi:hypothetical protein
MMISFEGVRRAERLKSSEGWGGWAVELMPEKVEDLVRAEEDEYGRGFAAKRVVLCLVEELEKASVGAVGVGGSWLPMLDSG